MTASFNHPANLWGEASRRDRADRRRPKYAAPSGLTRETVLLISKSKREPAWMRDKRLAAFELYQRTPLPTWGPDLSHLDLDRLSYYIRPGVAETGEWQELPADLRRTFDRLGVPQAEHHLLSGSGAQYDSDVVYHRLKREWSRQGVIFESMDVAVRRWPKLVRPHFMTDCVPISDHKFAMLHAAAWSGGSFIYVPPRVKVTLPLQAYFRMNAAYGGQFEHTLIIADRDSQVDYIEGCSAPRYFGSSLHAGCVEIHVKAGARVRYASVENWSRDVWNLNTKRALVDAGGAIEWLSGNLGSGTTMLYPMSVLRGAGARSEMTGIVVAGAGQELDVGHKVVHAAPDTASTVRSKTLVRGGGRSAFRGQVLVTRAGQNARSSVTCDALMLDSRSVVNAYPAGQVENDTAEVSHEATIGRIGDEELFYLRSRGLTEDQARKLIVAGFVEPVVSRLPLEYAVELNRLVELEMERKV